MSHLTEILEALDEVKVENCVYNVFFNSKGTRPYRQLKLLHIDFRKKKKNQNDIQYKISVSIYQQIKFGHKKKQQKPNKFILRCLYIVRAV